MEGPEPILNVKTFRNEVSTMLATAVVMVLVLATVMVMVMVMVMADG